MADGSLVAYWLGGARMRWFWRRIGAKVTKGMAPSEVEQKLGTAARMWSADGLRFWAYDCFVSGGKRHGITVVFERGRVQQVYWRVEPSDSPESSSE